MTTDWILIHTFGKNYLAEIAKEVLLDNDIEAVVFDKTESSYTYLSTFELYVKPENAEKAFELIKQIEN